MAGFDFHWFVALKEWPLGILGQDVDPAETLDVHRGFPLIAGTGEGATKDLFCIETFVKIFLIPKTYFM